MRFSNYLLYEVCVAIRLINGFLRWR
jgi:hypothetical protein